MAEYWDLNRLKREIPYLNYGPNTRFPIEGAFVQPRAGTARHDAVNWGYARAADQLGVHILQNTEVLDFIHEDGGVVGVRTNRGDIRAAKIGMAVAGSTSTACRTRRASASCRSRRTSCRPLYPSRSSR